MKNETRENDIIAIAEKIIQLEEDAKLSKDFSQIAAEIELIASNLTLDEMLQIDEYIMKKFLTK